MPYETRIKWRNGNQNSLLQFDHPYTPEPTGPGFGIVQGTTTFHALRVSSGKIPISILPGDFDGSGVVDAGDIDSLVNGFATQSHQFDVTDDGTVDLDDHRTWVKDFTNTYFGDANLDGEFNSADFVSVFQAGKYETNQDPSWSEGDSNGDGTFSSGDFVTKTEAAADDKSPARRILLKRCRLRLASAEVETNSKTKHVIRLIPSCQNHQPRACP